MVDLKARPYYLSDEDIRWVEATIASMTDEEKVGQLFFQLTAGMDEAYLKELMEKYHLGGCRYNNMPGQYVKMQNAILQKYAKVPLIIACNTENGGAGACSDGTYIAPGIKIGATGNARYAHDLGRLSNEEAASIGCNMAFAPVCDIHSNWENTEVVARAFGNDPDRVAEMSKAYLDGAHTIPGYACAAKHFPGNGEDFRDAHLSNNVNSMTQTRLEALKSVNYSISRITDEYVVLSDCDVICNVDLNDIIKDHIKNDADMTIAVKTMEMTPEQAKINVLFESDPEGRITDVLTYPTQFRGKADIGLNIVVMKTEYLQQIVLDSIAHNYVSLTRDVIARNMHHMNYRVYKYDGYFASISSFADYYAHSMELLTNPAARDALFNVKNRPIYTKVRNSVPAHYSSTSDTKDSLIADGCEIEGTVINSILFRGVKVGRNATVKNCILMQDTIIGDGAFLNCVITDKNAVVRDNRMLAGAETQPFYITKGKMI